jgi:hypothetical protein
MYKHVHVGHAKESHVVSAHAYCRCYESNYITHTDTLLALSPVFPIFFQRMCNIENVGVAWGRRRRGYTYLSVRHRHTVLPMHVCGIGWILASTCTWKEVDKKIKHGMWGHYVILTKAHRPSHNTMHMWHKDAMDTCICTCSTEYTTSAAPPILTVLKPTVTTVEGGPYATQTQLAIHSAPIHWANLD